MTIDHSFSNLNVVSGKNWTVRVKDVHVHNKFSFKQLHPRITPRYHNTGEFLSEPRDRRFILQGYELSIPPDGLSATLYQITDGRLGDVLANQSFSSSSHLSAFHLSERPVFFLQLNRSNFWFEHESDYIIALYFTHPVTSRLHRVPLYKKQLTNVIFEQSTLRLNYF